VAARYFDDLIIREDVATRGRERGETASIVLEGVREAQATGARAGSVQVVTDEMEAARRALDRSRPGDLVVLCVDHASEVWHELEERRSRARSGGTLPDAGENWHPAPGDPHLTDEGAGL
jgi:cyanophycin synthetase